MNLTDDQIETLESELCDEPCPECGRPNDWLYEFSNATHHFFHCDDCNIGGLMVPRRS